MVSPGKALHEAVDGELVPGKLKDEMAVRFRFVRLVSTACVSWKDSHASRGAPDVVDRAAGTATMAPAGATFCGVAAVFLKVSNLYFKKNVDDFCSLTNDRTANFDGLS